jgi:DNA-binding response OmpR family regulator
MMECPYVGDVSLAIAQRRGATRMPPPSRILLASLGERVEEYLLPVLEAEGYSVQQVVGFCALLEAMSRPLDLVLLDLPDGAALPRFAELRAACSAATIVIGPARDDRLLIDTLEAGADDYVQRPFRTAELLARVRAQLRRCGDAPGLTFGPLSLDLQGRAARCDGTPLDLSAEELTLLTLLAGRPGNSYPAPFIAGQIWGHARSPESTRVADLVARLRDRIEPDPRNPSVLGGDPDRGYWLGGQAQERHLNGR